MTNKEGLTQWRRLEQDDTYKIKTGHAMLCHTIIFLWKYPCSDLIDVIEDEHQG